MVDLDINGMKFKMNDFLHQKLLNVKYIQKRGYDCVIIISGGERTGKSTLGKMIAWFLSDGEVTINNFARGREDAKKKLKEIKDKGIFFFDETSLGLSAKDHARKETKELLKIFDVMGQKRLISILVLPDFLDLHKQLAVRRSRFLLQVYTDDKLNRGSFAYYGEKTKSRLYSEGKKERRLMNKVSPNFRGSFANFIPPFEEEYLKLKKSSMDEALEGEVDQEKLNKFSRTHIMTEMVGRVLDKFPNITTRELSVALDVPITTIRHYSLEYRNKTTK